MDVMERDLLNLAIRMFEAQRVYWDHGRTQGAFVKARELEKQFGKSLEDYRGGPGLFDKLEATAGVGPKRESEAGADWLDEVTVPELFGRKWTGDERVVLDYKAQEWALPIFCGCPDCVKELGEGRVFRHMNSVARDLAVWLVGAVAVLRGASDAPGHTTEELTHYLRVKLDEENGR